MAMTGEYLRLYVDERRRHHGVLLWEWLLEQANAIGIRGGSAFRAIGGFGRHHVLHESQFFELAGSTAVEVEFIVDAKEAEAMMSLVRNAGICVFYVRVPVEFGVINADESAGNASEESGKH
ncbi:DUF190 domain-containing protein [uncultured Propionivibrio sp.]|uniref:DUF190 domain-containing protein n=1 Tax=uncultured Propionivibrio sp. TaxID=426737 RepID=UPI0029BFE4D4|nr:DUF190 domain-containing protein [uncultured Propionivibrio sp.]